MGPVDADAFHAAEPSLEQSFHGTLVQYQDEGKLRRQLRELQFGASRVAFVERNRINAMAEFERFSGDPSLLEQFEGVRMKSAGVAVPGRARFLVDHLDPDSALRQSQRAEHAHRTGSNYQHFSLILSLHGSVPQP